MSDEQVKGIPEDLRGIYDHASQFAGHMGDHQTVDGMICRLIERIARSEQALAALEARNKELARPLSDEEKDALEDAIEIGAHRTWLVVEGILAARAALKGAS